MSVEQASEKLRGILTRMNVPAEVVGREEPDRIILEIRGEDTALLIGKHGATLDALQYLVQRMMLGKGPLPEGRVRGERGERGDGGKLIIVDAEGYRDRRSEALIELAKRLAAKARKTRRPVAASPMTPADRRVMHVALADEPGLSTQSEGEGASRHLVVVPDPNFDFGPQDEGA